MTADRLVSDLKTDHTKAALLPRDRAMLDYSVKLTMVPEQVTAADIGELKKFDFDDRAIHDICAIVAYFAFANRIADGLGIQLER